MKLLERDPRYIDIDVKDLPNVEGVSTYLLKLLYARGAKDERSVREFLNPSIDMLMDPMLFVDMDKAVSRIKKAILGSELICVFGDYDCDGICATAILVRYLKECGAKISYHIPSRHEHGYGMSKEAVQLLHEHNVGLIITVDNGITAASEVRFASSLGMDVIVTDHHRFQGELPDCCAVICHTRPDNTYPESILCGAGVALKLVHALSDFETMQKYIPLAGLATIADIVPLISENRVLASLAIEAINKGECFPGITAIVRETTRTENGVICCDARDLSFGVIPRINAAGRMKDAMPGVSLFLTNDMDEAETISKELTALNMLRREEEQRIYDSAIKMIESSDLTDERVIMLYSKEWNPGVIGIAASRICDRYYRPTIIFSLQDGTLTGSARSIDGVDIFSILHEHRDMLTRYGGHMRAAGATLSFENFEAFKASVNSYVRANFKDELFIPKQFYELDTNLSELSMELVDEIEKLAPFGECNPMPTFCIKNAKARNLRRIGEGGYHLKFMLMQNKAEVETVFYCMGHELEYINSMDTCSLVCTPTINTWRGNSTLHLRAKAISSGKIRNIGSYINAYQNRFGGAFYRNMRYNSHSPHVDLTVVDASECVYDFLKSDITGSIILCFSAQGAIRLLQDIHDADLYDRVDIRLMSQKRLPIAYNSIVLAPVLDELDIRAYRNLLVYDAAPSLGLLNKIQQLAPDASLFVGIPKASFAIDFKCSRDYMSKHYIALKAAAQRPKKHRADIMDAMMDQTKMAAWESALAIDIFIELGFVIQGNGSELTLVIDPKKRDLSESPLYLSAESIPLFYKQYLHFITTLMDEM